MFQLEWANQISVSRDIVVVFVGIVLIFGTYMFSHHLLEWGATLFKKIGEKAGTYSVAREYSIQKYVYQHSNGLVAKLYWWVNEQLIALGFKRAGVTVVGYLIFWGFISLILSVVLCIIARMGMFFAPILFIVCFIAMLIVTRVMVSERMLKREADVMNAIDLIVPEVGDGVQNAIVMYRKNFVASLRPDFEAFISNIQDRGMTFEVAMTILADNLGYVFHDFSQKAIYYEAIGDKEMLIIFSDITETNRLRRQLRTENERAFTNLKASFLISVVMTFGYFVFLMFTDTWSRNFFLNKTSGKILLMVIIAVVLCVLSYISTIKSKSI